MNITSKMSEARRREKAEAKRKVREARRKLKTADAILKHIKSAP